MKSWWESRTVLLNGAAVVFFVCEAIVQVATTLPVPESIAPTMAVLVGIANVILRFSTRLPIK